MAEKKKPQQRHGFRTSEYIVYPAHGVGRIVSIEEQEIAGAKLELFVINFEKDKMTLRVPTAKLASVGMRKLSEEKTVKKALGTLKGKARVKRTMWSRRAQEYEAKINSGDLVSIAEVVRDLYRSEAQPEQSYSERQLYEAALDRMAREIAAVEQDGRGERRGQDRRRARQDGAARQDRGRDGVAHPRGLSSAASEDSPSSSHELLDGLRYRQPICPINTLSSSASVRASISMQSSSDCAACGRRPRSARAYARARPGSASAWRCRAPRRHRARHPRQH